MGILRSNKRTRGIYRLDPFLRKEKMSDKHDKRVHYRDSQLKYTKTCKNCPCLRMFDYQYEISIIPNDEDVNFPPPITSNHYPKCSNFNADQVKDVTRPPPILVKLSYIEPLPPH